MLENFAAVIVGSPRLYPPLTSLSVFGARNVFHETFQARVCDKIASEGSDSFDEAEAAAERDASARDFLAVSKAGVRALVSPTPGLKIGPAEVQRYTEASMASIPWE